jgi:hypothetical protein
VEGRIRTERVGGSLLVVGGVGFFLAGALHPQPVGATSFHDAMLSMLSNARWPAAHWTALVSGVVLAWAISLLVDAGWVDGSVGALAGARLAMIATLFMSVEWAVEIAVRGGTAAYARGDALPMANLVDAMQGVGWPALGVGFALLALFTRGTTPRWVSIAGAIGAVALALAGVLAQALQIAQAGVLFLGGHLLALWMAWAGIHLVRQGPPRIAARQPAARAMEIGAG